MLLPESGRQAAVWDLHLGSRLRVLGRVVTLKNAELATIEWHDRYCRKMAAIRDAIAQVRCSLSRPQGLGWVWARLLLGGPEEAAASGSTT